MNYYECARRWWRGESGESSTMFSTNGIIYSYGYHFPIARRFNGKVLFTSRDYSVTTSKHKSIVMKVCRYDVVFVTDPEMFPRYTREQVVFEIQLKEANLATLAGKVDRAREWKQWLYDSFKRESFSLQDFVLFCRDSFPFEIPDPKIPLSKYDDWGESEWAAHEQVYIQRTKERTLKRRL